MLADGIESESIILLLLYNSILNVGRPWVNSFNLNWRWLQIISALRITVDSNSKTCFIDSIILLCLSIICILFRFYLPFIPKPTAKLFLTKWVYYFDSNSICCLIVIEYAKQSPQYIHIFIYHSILLVWKAHTVPTTENHIDYAIQKNKRWHKWYALVFRFNQTNLFYIKRCGTKKKESEWWIHTHNGRQIFSFLLFLKRFFVQCLNAFEILDILNIHASLFYTLYIVWISILWINMVEPF